MPLAAGQILDQKYRIVRLVGEGGMGAVYEAEHTFLGRRVAIKMLSAEFAHNAEAVRRFHREAQAAARIGHENICEVTDIGQTAGTPYIVMQLLQGKSLAQAIVESAPFPVGRAVDIAQQTLEALAAAHAAGIVHRDMKPDNIFLTKVAGRDDFAKVLDFGISKIRSAGGGTKLTQEGTVLGTPQYMAPEQARGESDVDGRVDVWAVGVIVFEMLTGQVPFGGANYNQVLFNVVSAPIPRLRALRQGITPEFESVVMRALDRDVGRRFGTPLELRDALLAAWMGTGESGFAVREAAPPPTSLEQDATELAPVQLLVGAAADGRPALAARREPPRGGDSGPVGPVVSNIFVAEPAGTVGASSSPSGVPTSPRGMAAARLADRGTVGVTPGATVVTTSGSAGSGGAGRRRVPVVPIAILGVTLVGIIVFLVVRFSGDSSSGDVTGPGGAPSASADAGAVAIATPGLSDATVTHPASDHATALAPERNEADVAPTGQVDAAPETAAAAAKESDAGSAGDGPAGVPLEDPAPDAGPVVAGDARPEVVAPPPRRNTGTLTVFTDPVVDVYVDGRRLGRAPILEEELTAGSHRILFLSQARGIRKEEPLVVLSGRNTELRRTARELGVSATPSLDAGSMSTDAGRIPDGVRIRTETYGRGTR